MAEKRWMGWQIPEDVEQEVSYMISMFGRTNSMEEKWKLDREIQDLIMWSTNSRPKDAPPLPGTRTLSRKEAIMAQRERRE